MSVLRTDAGDVVSVREGCFLDLSRDQYFLTAHKAVAAKYAQVLAPGFRLWVSKQTSKDVRVTKLNGTNCLSNLNYQSLRHVFFS